MRRKRRNNEREEGKQKQISGEQWQEMAKSHSRRTYSREKKERVEKGPEMMRVQIV